MSAQDVEECLELIEESQASIKTEETGRRARQDNVSSIFEIVKNCLYYKDNGTEEEAELEKKIVARGFKVEDLKKTLKSYERAGVLMAVGNNSYKLVNTQ